MDVCIGPIIVRSSLGCKPLLACLLQSTAMQIYVNILGYYEEGRLCLDVEANDSLDSVKAKIQWRKLIPPDHQKLFSGSTLLEGNRPISPLFPTRVSDHATWRFVYPCGLRVLRAGYFADRWP